MADRKTLYILRHAQAPAAEDMPDRDRPLSAAGESAARALAETMKEKAYLPDFILCSPATRTRQTCDLVRGNAPIACDEKIYMASTGDLYEIVKNADDRYDSLMLVGHNPGVHGLARLLAGSGDAAVLSRLAAGYPPGSLAVLECGCKSWASLMPGMCRLSDFRA